jgi:hypothetical protein
LRRENPFIEVDNLEVERSGWAEPGDGYDRYPWQLTTLPTSTHPPPQLLLYYRYTNMRKQCLQ